MSYTESLTQTYTIADIGKVIDCFAADLDMTSQSTGLLTRTLVKQYAADVKAMAQKGYLVEANIVLKDSAGERDPCGQVRSIHRRRDSHRQSTRKQPLAAQRRDGELSIVVRNSQKWHDLTDSQRAAFRRDSEHILDTSNTDLSFPALTRSADRNYVSNGWGVTQERVSLT